MGSVYKRGKFYWIKYYVGRKRVYESTKTTSKRDAKLRLAQREGTKPEVWTGRLKYSDLLADFLSEQLRNNRKDARNVALKVDKHLVPFFEFRFVSNSSGGVALVVSEYVQKRKRYGASNETINRGLAWIRRTFNLALENGKVQFAVKIKALKEVPPRSDFYEQEELEEVLGFMDSDTAPIPVFANWCGWRKSEVLNLQFANIDFRANEIRINPGGSKNDQPRMIIMTKAIREMMQTQKRKAESSPNPECPWVWHRNGEKIKSFREMWDTARTNADAKRVEQGLEPAFMQKTFHALRRSASRNMELAGIPDRVIMAVMGHKTRTMFDRYRQVPRKDLQDAAKKLEK